MDDDLRACLDAIESRLMGRLNDSNEQLREQVRWLETTVGILVGIDHNTNALLELVVKIMADSADRVTRLEIGAAIGRGQ